MASSDENALEEYKREFLERKAEERRVEKERKLHCRKTEFKLFRWSSILVLIIAVILLSDYWLPSTVHKEIAVEGWQEMRGRGSSAILMSFMKTKSFKFDAPNEVHSGYDYNGESRNVISIETTPVLKTIKTLETQINNELWTWEPETTVYTNVPFLPYLLFISSIISLVRKTFSETNYWLAIIPNLLLGLIILIWLFAS